MQKAAKPCRFGWRGGSTAPLTLQHPGKSSVKNTFSAIGTALAHDMLRKKL